MYVNKEKVASTKDYRTQPPLRITDHTVYLGRPNEDVADGRYADAIVDELEYWFVNRDLLNTLNLIPHGTHSVTFNRVCGLVTCVVCPYYICVCVCLRVCVCVCGCVCII